MSNSERIELGCAGHLIVADNCRWRRHTQVRHYRVSTLGEYYPSDGVRSTVGSGARDYFESMVFAISDAQCEGSEGCGCREVLSWSEVDCQRYATAGEAQQGHEALVAKYAASPPAHAALPAGETKE